MLIHPTSTDSNQGAKTMTTRAWYELIDFGYDKAEPIEHDDDGILDHIKACTKEMCKVCQEY